MSGHESVKSHRRTGSLLFGLSGTQLNGEREERMSVDGERDGSGAVSEGSGFCCGPHRLGLGILPLVSGLGVLGEKQQELMWIGLVDA